MRELAIQCSQYIKKAGPGKVVVLVKDTQEEVRGGIIIPASVVENMSMNVHNGQVLGECAIVANDTQYDLRVGDIWRHVIDSAYTSFNRFDSGMEWIPDGYTIRIYGAYAEQPIEDIIISKVLP